MTAITDDYARVEFENVRISSIIVVGRNLKAPSISSITIDGEGAIAVNNVEYDSSKITFFDINLSITKSFQLNWSA